MSSAGTGCLVAVGIVGFLVVLASISTHDAAPSVPDRADAKQMCEQFVSKRLKAPATADFSGALDTGVTHKADGSWRVTGYVDAQNAFGAKLRNDYACDLQYVSGETWRALDVQLIPR